MMQRRSSCSCGAVTLFAQGEPIRISMCHCFECQTRTGSVFGVQARFARSQVTTAGNTTAFARTVEGEEIRFHFCPKCGSTVYWFLGELPDMIVVAVGNFADPAFPSPKVAVYESRKHAWVETPECVNERLDVVNQ